MKHVSLHQVINKISKEKGVILFATINAVLLQFSNNVDAVLL